MSKLSCTHSNGCSSSTSSNGPHQLETINVTNYFMEDLISQILDRLPVKTLLRYRCVSKPWCSLIDSPLFVKAHLKRFIECNTNTSLIIGGFSFYETDLDSLDDTTAVEIDERLRTLLRGTQPVGSCNALVCLFQGKHIFLWNPATKKYRHLPTLLADFVRPLDIDPSFFGGFGYDVVNGDYKVLRILLPDDRDLAGSKVIVYSLKNNSWGQLQNISNHFRFIRYWGMFLGGALHWITIKTLSLESCLSILAFDLAVENYREFPLPNVQNQNPYEWSLCIFANSLCVLTYHHYIRIEVWSMNDYGVENSWCKLFLLEHPTLVRFSVSVRPVAYSKNRSDVLFEVLGNKVIWYNLERKKIRTVKNMPDVCYNLEVCTKSLVPLDYIVSCDGKQPQEIKIQPQQQKMNGRHNKFLSK